MGRPRKVNKSTGKAFRSDRELVDEYQTNYAEEQRLTELSQKKTLGPIQEKKLRTSKNTRLKAIYELWDKYFKLRMKMKFELISLARRNNLHITEIVEEYDAYAWATFITQMDGIDLSRVEHLPNWSMYIRVWGYWRSMNRDILKEWFNWTLNTVPIEGIIKNDGKNETESSISNIDVQYAKDSHNSVENKYDMDLNKKIFWESIDQLKTFLTEKQKKLLNMKINGIKNSEILKKLNITNNIYKEQLAFIKSQFNVVIQEVGHKYNSNMNYEELTQALAS